jgi:hypothetical protein
VTLPRQVGPNLAVMRKRIVVVAALAVLLVGWMLFRPPALTRTELSPAKAADVVAPDDPAPHLTSIPSATPIAPVERAQTTNLLALLLKGELPILTPDQLQCYLEANHRDAESLLAAYQATHERALLDEAIAKYPNDPRVAYAAWFRSPATGDPGALQARRQALDLLKQAAPDNALANYLSAANYFKSGQPELAVQELQAGAAKPSYNDYTQDAIQSMEEAYRAAGYSDIDSKAAATSGALLPHLAEMKQAGLSLVELANSYQQAGDPSSAQAALQMCLDLGQRLDDPNSLTLIQTLVGNAIQRAGLAAMAAAAPDADAAQAIQERLDTLNQQRAGIRALVADQPIETWLPNAPSEEVNAYYDRMRLFGEQRALQWLATRR